MVSVCKFLFTNLKFYSRILSIKFGYLKTLVGLQGLNDEQQHYTFVFNDNLPF